MNKAEMRERDDQSCPRQQCSVTLPRNQTWVVFIASCPQVFFASLSPGFVNIQNVLGKQACDTRPPSYRLLGRPLGSFPFEVGSSEEAEM